MSWPARTEAYENTHGDSVFCRTVMTTSERMRRDICQASDHYALMSQCQNKLDAIGNKDDGLNIFNTVCPAILGENRSQVFCELIMALQSYLYSDIQTLYYVSTQATQTLQEPAVASPMFGWAARGVQAAGSAYVRLWRDLHGLILYSHVGIAWLTGVCKRLVVALCSLIRSRNAPNTVPLTVKLIERVFSIDPTMTTFIFWGDHTMYYHAWGAVKEATVRYGQSKERGWINWFLGQVNQTIRTSPIDINNHIKYALADANSDVFIYVQSIIDLFAADDGTPDDCKVRIYGDGGGKRA